MGKTYAVVGGMLVALSMTVGGGVVWAQQGVAEKAGEKLNEAGQAVKRGLQKAGDTVREGFAKTRESVHNMSVESRVYGRLHWDKALTASSLEVEVKGSTVTLRGSVPDAVAKAKAVTLAGETVGVSQVIDQLAVPAPTARAPLSTTPPATAPRP
ncbi:MAG TPA: BON domain-containing protein [Isosphaeraceae bacterium]|jgi:osmotically-inducible protein OsmY|nr:BON domain-containing protein [Isosphaeraceae bacterium]